MSPHSIRPVARSPRGKVGCQPAVHRRPSRALSEARDMAEGGGDDSAGGDGAPTVFISYASQDAAVANALVEALEHCRLPCWIAPRDVIAGSLYADAIVRAINDTKVFLLVLSVHAGASPHVGRRSSGRPPNVGRSSHCAPIPSRSLTRSNTTSANRSGLILGLGLRMQRPPLWWTQFGVTSSQLQQARQVLLSTRQHLRLKSRAMGVLPSQGSDRERARSNALRSIRSPCCPSH
jgi:hypothetical protein